MNDLPKDSQIRIGDVAEALLGYVESGTTFQAERMMTVPAATYTDQGLWRAEVDLIFKRLPLMLALSCEMPKPGDYKAMEVVGLPILIARDKAGIARAFFNVCAHRWALVAAEGHGNCPAFRFTCPFHGWTYGADGRLSGVADRAKFGDIDKTKHGLKELPCEERHGMIFCSLTPGETLDLDGYYGALLDEFADAGLSNWTFLGSSVLEAPNWKLVCANFFESYHFATQHQKTVAVDYVSNVNHFEAFGPNMRIGFVKHAIAQLRETPRAQWHEQEGPAFTFMRYLFPNVIGSLGLFEASSSFGQLFPGPTPDRTRVVVLHLSRERPKDEDHRKALQKEAQLADDRVLRDEDFVTGLAAQKGLVSAAHEHLLYGRNERGPQYFHEWVNWYLKADPNAPRPML
jgi:phenylpropionate dioxygenase-like ring-hydroxylating dioxygenase large terminal subunit